jgi:excisionase family DNA binding protein
MSSNLILKRKCEFCGTEFGAKTLYTRYCSHICNRRHYKKIKRESFISKVLQEQKNTDNKLDRNESSVQGKEFLSIDETAELLGTSKRTIQRLLSKGTLRMGKIGRRTIIKRQDIDNLFK